MQPPPLRRPLAALLALAAAVLALHLLGVQWLAEVQADEGEGAARARPRRMDVQFVRQLAPSAPALVTVATRALPPPVARLGQGVRALAPRAAAAASAVAAAPEDESTDLSGVEAVSEVKGDGLVLAAAPRSFDAPTPDAPTPDAEPPRVPPPAAPVDPATRPELPPPDAPASSAAATAAAAPSAFEWPPSTRLSYRLSGNYRGPVQGQARVEWLRSGGRYQVFMDLSIGPSFAPLMSRRVSSEGQITDQGLAPRRYDEETQVLLMSPRRLVVDMGASSVTLANGSRAERPAGLQDSASQFVQLTWLFTTRPELLQTGRSIVLPLALPRSVEPWTYDVVGSEMLRTPAGAVLAVHVKPRREPRPGGDLTAEIWVAPSLQYLPVRILIRQDADTWIDLTVDRLPEQAARLP